MQRKEGTYRNKNVVWRKAMGLWVKSCIKLIDAVNEHTDTFSGQEYDCLCQYMLGGSFEQIASRKGVTQQAVRYSVIQALSKFEQAMESYEDTLKENELLKSELARKGIQMNYESLEEARKERKALLDTPVEDLCEEIGAKVCSMLKIIGVKTLGDLAEQKKYKLKAIRGIGRNVELIQKILEKRGLKFGMSQRDFIELI